MTVEPPVVTTSSTIRQRSPGVEQRPLDPALQPVLLALLAHEEGLDVRAAASAAQATGSAPIVMPPTAVAPARSASSRDQLAQRAEPGRQQDRPLGVDVVLRRRAARERDLADDQGVLAQLRDQRLSGSGFGTRLPIVEGDGLA